MLIHRLKFLKLAKFEHYKYEKNLRVDYEFLNIASNFTVNDNLKFVKKW